MTNVILKLPAWLEDEDSRRSRDSVDVIFFITGNPGLIGYYSDFLEALSNGNGKDAIIAGFSLAGFELSGLKDTTLMMDGQDLIHPDNSMIKSIHSLQDQINITETRIARLVEKTKWCYGLEAIPFRVTLIGHSVGAYIALEIVNSLHSNNIDASPYQIVATMLLTPTIHDIAQSPSGKVATPLLSNIPFFPALVQLGASSLTYTLPTAWLRGIVASITRMTGNALSVTVAFLQSPGAVRQALFMAKCEMLEIGTDKWTEDVWGISDQQKAYPAAERQSTTWRAPKHYFLFARTDHWVADGTRESVVASMGTRAKIVIDSNGELGLVHAWCLQQSQMVANIVDDWISEVRSDANP